MWEEVEKEKVDDLDLTLYEPTGRDYFGDYPEMQHLPELQNLKPREIKLCWLLGSKTSPIIRLPAEQRLKTAIKKCYKGQSLKRKEVADMYEKSLIPDSIIAGANRFASFNISLRLRAKLMDEFMFDRLTEMIYISEENYILMDLDDRKRYADLMLKVSGEMPDMVIRMESGFGIKNKSSKDKTGKIKAGVKDIMDRLP